METGVIVVLCLLFGSPILVLIIMALSESGISKGVGRTYRSAVERHRVMVDRRHREKIAALEAAKPPKATCECGHSLAFHTDGRCHADAPKAFAWKTVAVYPDAVAQFRDAVVIGPTDDSDGDPMVIIRYPHKWEPGTCECRRYVGPEPMVTLTMPDLSMQHVQLPTNEKSA